MVSGYFLAKGNWQKTWTFWKKTALLYGVCILLYLPLNIYAGQLDGDFPRRLVTDGTFYHLWYFPGLLLGLPIARFLGRWGLRIALPAAGPPVPHRPGRGQLLWPGRSNSCTENGL